MNVKHYYIDMVPNTGTKIRPAPDPRELLEKFGGTMSEHMYFELIHSPFLLETLPVSVTMLIPEVVEVRDEFIRKYYQGKFQGIRSNYRVKRQGSHADTTAEFELRGSMPLSSPVSQPSLPRATKRLKFI